jgi:hypothetical protein
MDYFSQEVQELQSLPAIEILCDWMLTWDKPTPVVSFGTRTGHSSWRGTTRSYLSVLRSLARFQKKCASNGQVLVAFGGHWLCFSLIDRSLRLYTRTLGNWWASPDVQNTLGSVSPLFSIEKEFHGDFHLLSLRYGEFLISTKLIVIFLVWNSQSRSLLPLLAPGEVAKRAGRREEELLNFGA